MWGCMPEKILEIINKNVYKFEYLGIAKRNLASSSTVESVNILLLGRFEVRGRRRANK